jgi:hypothetical protein
MPTVAKKTIDPTYYMLLEERARELLDADIKTRTRFIKEDFWLEYTAAEDILEDYQGLAESPEVHRPECRLLIGPCCNGKSELLRQVVERNPRYEREDRQGIVAPVIYLQAPRKPDEMGFFSGILRSVNAPFNASDRIDRRINQVLTLLKAVGCQVLIIDEIHNILAGSTAQHWQFRDTIRFLTNECQVSIVMGGVRKALTVVDGDGQLGTRLSVHYLPRWENNRAFRDLIAGFEMNLPLRSFSGVAESEVMRNEIFRLSGGLLGLAKQVMAKAAVKAMVSGTEQITLGLIKGLKLTPEGEKREVPRGLD